MGIFDKAREALHEHPDQVDPAVDRLAGEVDRRTGGTHRADVDRGADLAEDRLGADPPRDPAAEQGR